MSQRFVYRASAVPFGGEITQPFSEVLDVQASTSLSPDGGAGSARAEAFRFRELVSFDAAYSQVIGRRDDDGTNETLAQAVVEGLNIQDVVTADRIVARLTSSRSEEEDPDELPMRPVGSYFVNLRIAGIPIDLSPRPEVFRETTKTKLDACKPKNQEGRHLTLSLFDEKPLEALRSSADVKSGARIVIPDFGTVTLGEFIVTANSRRITMVRVEMGSPMRGWMTGAALEGNGSPY